MNYTERSIKTARGLAEAAIRMDISEIPQFVSKQIAAFRIGIDMDCLEGRQEMSAMISTASTLLLNYDLNAGSYLFGEKEIERSRAARKEIAKEATAMREAGI